MLIRRLKSRRENGRRSARMGDKHPLKRQGSAGIFGIAVIALCLGECLLLASLDRSYFWRTLYAGGHTDKSGFIVIFGAREIVGQLHQRHRQRGEHLKRFIASYPPGETFWLPREELESIRLGCVFRSYRNGSFFMAMPHWVLVLLGSGLAAVLIFKRFWRFSLRTLLIAVARLLSRWEESLPYRTEYLYRPRNLPGKTDY